MSWDNNPGDLQQGCLQERPRHSWNRLRLLPVPEDHPEITRDRSDMRKEGL